MSEKEDDAKFAAEWTEAKKGVDYFWMAHVLSGRLRQMDKRAKKSNQRADRAEQELSEEREACAALVEAIGIPRVVANDRILMLPPDIAAAIRNR